MIRSSLPRTMFFTGMAGISVLLMALASMAQSDSDQSRVPTPALKGPIRIRTAKAKAKLPEIKIPKDSLVGRFLARSDNTRISAFSPNPETYLFETQSQGSTQLVKLYYEFMDFEPRLPSASLNYTQLHSFYAIRDSRCDERWGALNVHVVVNSDGEFVEKRPALHYVQGASPPEVGDDAILPCYLIGRQLGR